jgi:hypothetical protein
MANSVARPSPHGRLQPGKGSVICQIAPLASLGIGPRMSNLSVAAEPMVMAFYSADPAMGQKLADLVHALEQEGRPGLGAQLSITWLRYAKSLCNREPREASPLETGSGASWRGGQLRQPGSLVNLIYLVACEAWLQRQLLRDEPELRRAMAAMVKPAPSAHGATGLIVDLLSGTTSGPSLTEDRFITWKSQRELVTHWLESLGWPELVGWQACQKTWADGPYGRELDFHRAVQGYRNLLTTDGTARLLEAVMAGSIISPPACRRMQSLLERPLGDSSMNTAELDELAEFINPGISPNTRIWGKASWVGEARHGAAYVETELGPPMLLIVVSEGATCPSQEGMLPEIAGRLMDYQPMR